MIQNNFNNQGMNPQMGQPQGSGHAMAQQQGVPPRKNIDMLLVVLMSAGLGLAVVIIFSVIYAIMRNSDFQRSIDISKKFIDLIKNSGSYSGDYLGYEKAMSGAQSAQTLNFLGLAFQIILILGMGALLFFAINNNKKLFVKIGLIVAFAFFVLSLGKMLGLLVDGYEIYDIGGYFAGKDGLKILSEYNLPKYATHPGLLATMMFFVSLGWAGLATAFYFLDKNLGAIANRIKERRAMNVVRMQQQAQQQTQQQAPQGFNPAGQTQQQAPQGFNPAGQTQQQAPQGFNQTVQTQQQTPQGFNPSGHQPQQAPQGFNPAGQTSQQQTPQN